MKNGAVGTIEASKVATGMNDELRFEIHGEKGAMRFNLMEPNWLEVYDTRDAGSPAGGMRGFKKIETVQRYPSPGGFPGPKFSVGWLRAHVACLYNFLDCVAKGKKAEPSLLHGARLQFIMEKAYESYRKRQWVKIG
jgi:predicted dehydrogenase